jgi:hypothetical protein
MITFIPQQFTGPNWKKIDLGGGDSIELGFSRPTLGDQLAALQATRSESVQAFRLRSQIIDWRGVSDPTGQPVPYSWEMLGELCRSYPNAIWDIILASKSKPETDLKNSGLPPLAGGTATEIGTATATPSSTFTATSGESATCAAGSE